jgi:hypothetical protein
MQLCKDNSRSLSQSKSQSGSSNTEQSHSNIIIELKLINPIFSIFWIDIAINPNQPNLDILQKVLYLIHDIFMMRKYQYFYIVF